MAIVRIHKTRDFTIMSNYHFKEKNMSLKAKGLLSLMLSLPDDWDYSVEGLKKLSKDGKESISSALEELEVFGYLKRQQKVDEKGKFCGYEYHIYETPQLENPQVETPFTENPSTDNPSTENHTQLNTNISNTKELNTNKKINILLSCEEIIDYLNKKTGKRYNPKSKATQRLIEARLKEGYTIEDFKTIVDNKVDKWISDEKMQQYLRPETLFCPKHFDSYLNEGAKKTNKTLNNEQFLLDKGFSLEYVSTLTKEEMARIRQKFDTVL